MEFRFTLFNGITLVVMAATLATAYLRAAGRDGSKWPLAYYGFAAAYAAVFARGLDIRVVLAGAALTLLVRFGILSKAARLLEMLVFAAIFWRALGLLLMW